eukprot:jgi/Bigna1/70148/fgenesh1_pg.11_\
MASSGAPAAMPSRAQQEREDRLRAYIGNPIKVTVSDGRVMIGRFQCCDDHVNVIMTETHQVFADGKEKPRHLGQILIPGQHISKIQIFLGNVPEPEPSEEAKALMLIGKSIPKKEVVSSSNDAVPSSRGAGGDPSQSSAGQKEGTAKANEEKETSQRDATR